MYTANPWADNIKEYNPVELFHVTQDNRHQLLEDILHWLYSTKSTEL